MLPVYSVEGRKDAIHIVVFPTTTDKNSHSDPESGGPFALAVRSEVEPRLSANTNPVHAPYGPRGGGVSSKR